MRRIAPWSTTGVPSRGAEQERAARAHMGRPSAPIAGGLMERGLMSVPPRGRPAGLLGSGGHLPPRREQGARPPRLLRTRPRLPRRWGRGARWRLRRGSSLPQRRWKCRGLRVPNSLFCLGFSFSFVSFFFLSLFLTDEGRSESGSPARIDFDLGRDSVKGGKMVTAAAMALRADM